MISVVFTILTHKNHHIMLQIQFDETDSLMQASNCKTYNSILSHTLSLLSEVTLF